MGVMKENPIHQEMNEAMHLVGCDFALSVVQNSHHRIVGAWAGNPESVMDAGVKLVDTMYKKEISEAADIVITAANGHPHDINLYQAMKAMHTACQVVKPRGVIILVAECPQGHGSQLYIDWLKKYRTSQEIQQALRDNFVIGAHKAFYHRITIENHPVILISEMDGPDVAGLFGFLKEATLNLALTKAFSISGDQSRVLVVPQGTTTFLTVKK
jgi:nickel-dependent lactate racemase